MTIIMTSSAFWWAL